MTRGLLFVLLFMQGTLCAASKQQRMEEAEVYLTAKRPMSAVAIYQQLEGEPLTLWERAVVAYGKGRALFAVGNYEQAIVEWETVLPIFPSPEEECSFSPWAQLASAVDRNLLLARLRLAALYREEQEKDPSLLLSLYATACQDLERVEQSCQPFDTQVAQKVHEVVRVEIARLLQQRDRHKRESSSSFAFLFFLKEGAREFLALLNLLDSARATPSLQGNYWELARERVLIWEQAWHGREEEFPKLAGLFEEAAKLIEAQESALSHTLLKRLESLLEEKMRELFQTESVPELLEELLGAYQTLLAMGVVEKGEWEQMERQLSGWVRLFHEKEPMEMDEGARQSVLAVLSELQVNREGTSQALSSLGSSAALLFLEDAVDLLRAAVQQQTTPRTVDNILKEGIANEEHALRLNQLSRPFFAEEKGREILLPLIEGAQQRVLSVVAPFVSAAIAEQRAAYRATRQCQCVPWKEVFPLFERGRKEAERARALLSPSYSQLAGASVAKREAIQIWERVRALLKEQEEEEAPSSYPRDLLQFIREMETLDAPSPSSTFQETNVEHPW